MTFNGRKFETPNETSERKDVTVERLPRRKTPESHRIKGRNRDDETAEKDIARETDIRARSTISPRISHSTAQTADVSPANAANLHSHSRIRTVNGSITVRRRYFLAARWRSGRSSGSARVKTRSGRNTYRLIGARSAADSDEFRRRMLILFDLAARLFFAAGSLVSPDISIPGAARGRPEERERKKRVETRRFRARASERALTAGCLARRRDVPASAASTSRMNNGSAG